MTSELEQRERLMALAHDAIIVREPGTSAVTYWNREASEIYGYAASDARGRVRMIFSRPSFRALARRLTRHCVRLGAGRGSWCTLGLTAGGFSSPRARRLCATRAR